MANFNSTQAIGQCGCVACGRFNNSNCDSCLIKIKTMNCDPNEWRNPANGNHGESVPSGAGVDPVRSNIYNGGWLCNYEPEQIQNGTYCKRQFFSVNIHPPFNVGCRVNAESRLRGITTYGNRFCKAADSTGSS